MALKAQFEPLLREEHAREQIRKLSQTGNVNNYNYRFRELMNEIPSMNSAEAYSLFMHGLDLQLRQLAGTLVTSGDLDEVIEVVKKVTVYGEDKKTSSQSKGENKQKGRQGNGKGAKGGKGSWGPNKGNGPKGQVQIVTGGSTSDAPSGTVMVVTSGGSAQNKKGEKNQKKKGKGKSGSRGQKPSPKCFLCGGNHIVRDCPEWKAVHDAVTKKQENA